LIEATMPTLTLTAANTIIDRARYVSPEVHARELEAIWRKHWLLAALSSDLQAPGACVAFDIGADSLIITRSEDATTLSAFHNACSHRGTRLLAEGVHTALTAIRCPYHAWSFAMDGHLRSAPDPNAFSKGLPTERLSLRPAKVAEWKGLVFVCMDLNAPPLEDFLGTVMERVAPFDIARMQLIEDQTVSHGCNWKAIIDNFAELYHVDYIHPQHRRFVDCTNARDELYANGHTGVFVPGATTDQRYPVPEAPTDIQSMQLAALGLDPKAFIGRVRDVPSAIVAAKRAQSGKNGFDYTPYTDTQLTEVWQINLFPNIILSGSPEGLWVMRSRPHPKDPSRSYFDKWTLMLPPDPALGGKAGQAGALHRASTNAATPSGRVARDVFEYADVAAGRKSMTDTIDQDLSLLAQVQAGMESSGFTEAWLSEREVRVAHFHRALDAALG
jgi:phenylpropionate dioxygenase-like ring-hydroxylating dioxygenase large terminal subunit